MTMTMTNRLHLDLDLYRLLWFLLLLSVGDADDKDRNKNMYFRFCDRNRFIIAKSNTIDCWEALSTLIDIHCVFKTCYGVGGAAGGSGGSS